MDDLTAVEVKVLNNLTDVHDPSVNLGDKFQEVVRSLPKVGTPVNAVAASMDLTLTGVVVDGEKVTIDNPLEGTSDVYEFLTDAAQTKSASTNIAVNVEASAVKAAGTLTMDTQPTAGDTVTIGTKTFIFVPVGTDNGLGEVSIGANLAGAQAALVAAINGTDNHNTQHPQVSAAAFVANACVLTAYIGGAAGNLIGTTETFTAPSNTFGGATLGTGADCSAADAITALVAAVTASDTQGVGATDEAGDVVKFTADVAGVVGNNIVIGETLANGAFTGDATKLAGGVDGTVGTVSQPLVDDSYLYVCVDDNTTADKNWRRISLGSAY